MNLAATHMGSMYLTIRGQMLFIGMVEPTTQSFNHVCLSHLQQALAFWCEMVLSMIRSLTDFASACSNSQAKYVFRFAIGFLFAASCTLRPAWGRKCIGASYFLLCLSKTVAHNDLHREDFHVIAVMFPVTDGCIISTYHISNKTRVG
jgi:hypothetical protein